MTDIHASALRFEDWQRTRLHGLFVEADLERKHRKMLRGPFAFLRATYWRWAEIVLDVLPQLADSPPILAVGDTHLENFGTWRDQEGRLIWGANDFDEACVMPWPLDLVRLAASAILADEEDAEADAICTAIWQGYRDGLVAPSPIVLERDWAWLRSQLTISDDERGEFWAQFETPAETIPAAYLSALHASLPGTGEPDCFARRAGTGSLGKPRFVACLGDWHGGPVIREAKAMLPSAWLLFHPGAVAANPLDPAQGAFRAPDPCLQIHEDILVRRLSPNSRKIEADEKGRLLLKPRMLEVMGREIANCHAGDLARIDGVRAEIAGMGQGWLTKSARQMARAVLRDQRDYAATVQL